MPLLYICLHGRFNEVTSLLFLFVSGRVVFQIWGATTAKWKDFSWQDVHFSRWTSTKYVHIGAVRPPFNRNVYSDLDSQNLVHITSHFVLPHGHMTVRQKKKPILTFDNFRASVIWFVSWVLCWKEKKHKEKIKN